MEFGPGVSELSSLSSAEDTALLENTRVRYDAGHIYTRSGRLLLAVNPYRKLQCYTDQVLQQYTQSLQPQAELPPHVYAVASSAHLGMMQNSMSQVRSPPCVHSSCAEQSCQAEMRQPSSCMPRHRALLPLWLPTPRREQPSDEAPARPEPRPSPPCARIAWLGSQALWPRCCVPRSL